MKNTILLADRESRAWDFAEKIQKYIEKEKGESIPLQEVSIKHFKNNEIDVHILENVRKKDVYFIQDSSKNPQEWWVELLLLKDLLLSSSAESVTFVLPDMLYSRKDRKEKPHVPISARALAKSLSSGIRRIITMDMHASQIQGFYPENIPLDHLYGFPAVVRYIKENNIMDYSPENLVVVSPDAGGVDRAKAFAQRLGKNSLAFIYKRRTVLGVGDSRDVEEMILVGDVEGKDVLIVDDIIDSGTTLCKAAQLLKQKGAKKLFCYGTHGFFTNGLEELKKSFDEVMTSNTHYREGNSAIVIDVSPLFAEAIYRAQKGESISELFK